MEPLVDAIIPIVVFGAIFYFLRKWFMEGYRGTDSSKGSSSKKAQPSKKEFTPRYKIKKLSETETSYEFNGSEQRTIDNSRSNGIVRRRLTISKEWSKTIALDETNIESKTTIGKIGNSILGLEGRVEAILQKKYRVSIQETKHFSEEVELEIAPLSKIVLHIEWKTIWQNGIVELENQNGDVVSIPYRVSKGVTFDQYQEKVD